MLLPRSELRPVSKGCVKAQMTNVSRGSQWVRLRLRRASQARPPRRTKRRPAIHVVSYDPAIFSSRSIRFLDPRDCFEFELHFRRADLDRTADLKPVFPDARLNHLDRKFYAFVVHVALPIRPRMPVEPGHPVPIRLAELQRHSQALASVPLERLTVGETSRPTPPTTKWWIAVENSAAATSAPRWKASISGCSNERAGGNRHQRGRVAGRCTHPGVHAQLLAVTRPERLSGPGRKMPKPRPIR